MKKLNIIAAAGLIGVLILAGCGGSENKDTAGSASEASSSSAAASSAASSSSAAKEGDEEAASAGDASGASSEETVTGEDIHAELLPTVEGDFTYEECMKLANYKGITLKKTVEEITEEDIDSYILSMAEMVEVEDPNAEAQNGDTVNIAYVGEKDGVAFEGGTSDGYDLVLGSGSFIPGFEEGVVGMKVGEKKDLDLTFPEQYHSADLAGADVVFHVTLNAIKRAPELTDEWVVENYDGEFTNLEELRAYTKESLEMNAQNAAEQTLRQDAWSQVFNNTEFFSLPADYVKEGETQYEKQYEAAASQYGMKLDEYLETSGVTTEQYEAEKQQYAQSVAKSILLMNSIWEAEKMTEDDEYDKIIESIASAYGMTSEEFISSQDPAAVEQYAKTQKILNFIVENAVIEE